MKLYLIIICIVAVLVIFFTDISVWLFVMIDDMDIPGMKLMVITGFMLKKLLMVFSIINSIIKQIL